MGLGWVAGREEARSLAAVISIKDWIGIGVAKMGDGEELFWVDEMRRGLMAMVEKKGDGCGEGEIENEI
ncbi:unnamed protein product [Prunus armeniaca]